MIKTDRLTIYPLNWQDLKLLIDNTREFEKKYNCKYDATPLTGIYFSILRNQIEITKKEEFFEFNTFWLVIHNDIVIGAACFKGIKDDSVEIGYGLGEKYTGQGFMTETVKAMCEFAFKKVNNIIAFCDKDNAKSINLLKRVGFEFIEEQEELLFKLKKES